MRFCLKRDMDDGLGNAKYTGSMVFFWHDDFPERVIGGPCLFRIGNFGRILEG